MSPREQNFDMENLYLRFLQIANVIQRGSLSELDETSIALLNEIAFSHLNGNALTVSQAMSLANLASATTIHRKLDTLLQANLVELKFEGDNRRTKFIGITKTGDRYLSSLSKAMIKAVKLA
jgi:DNA-binding transcriptional ArsR family regulator